MGGYVFGLTGVLVAVERWVWWTVDVRDIWDRRVEDALGLILLSGGSILRSISTMLLAGE